MKMEKIRFKICTAVFYLSVWKANKPKSHKQITKLNCKFSLERKTKRQSKNSLRWVHCYRLLEWNRHTIVFHSSPFHFFPSLVHSHSLSVHNNGLPSRQTVNIYSPQIVCILTIRSLDGGFTFFECDSKTHKHKWNNWNGIFARLNPKTDLSKSFPLQPPHPAN